MIVLTEYALKQLMTAIVNASHGLVDETGEAVISNTIGEPQLRMAALTSIMIATGNSIWPGDRPITIRRPKQTLGIFREE